MVACWEVSHPKVCGSEIIAWTNESRDLVELKAMCDGISEPDQATDTVSELLQFVD